MSTPQAESAIRAYAQNAQLHNLVKDHAKLSDAPSPAPSEPRQRSSRMEVLPRRLLNISVV